MRRLIKASDLSKNTGISRHTIKCWCKRDPELAVKKKGHWWLRLDRLAEKSGLDPARLFVLTQRRWIKATDFTRGKYRLPRRTVAYWCLKRPNFAIRLGRVWYVCLDEIASTYEESEALRKWAMVDMGNSATGDG